MTRSADRSVSRLTSAARFSSLTMWAMLCGASARQSRLCAAQRTSRKGDISSAGESSRAAAWLRILVCAHDVELTYGKHDRMLAWYFRYVRRAFVLALLTLRYQLVE